MGKHQAEMSSILIEAKNLESKPGGCSTHRRQPTSFCGSTEKLLLLFPSSGNLVSWIGAFILSRELSQAKRAEPEDNNGE